MKYLLVISFIAVVLSVLIFIYNGNNIKSPRLAETAQKSLQSQKSEPAPKAEKEIIKDIHLSSSEVLEPVEITPIVDGIKERASTLKMEDEL